MYQEIQVFEIASWPFELDSCAFCLYDNGKVNE